MNNHILLGCAGINTALLLNYCLWFVGASSIAPWLCVPFVFLGFLYLCICVFRYQLSLWPIPVFVLMLLLVSLSTPAVAWDARSIWLFHAKRIFLDDNLFAQLDGYAAWSHNDYPVIIPAFSASLAGFVGLWNEIFPKVANVVFLIAPLFLLGAVFRNVVSIVFFLVALIYICSHYLHNGFVDANVAVIIASVVLIIFEIHKLDSRDKNLLFYVLSSSLAILCLMKNEGILLSAIFLIFFFFYNFLYKFAKKSEILFVSALPLFFVSTWKYYCFTHDVTNDIVGSNLYNQALSRVLDLNSVVTILSYIFDEIWVALVFILVLMAIFYKKNEFCKNIYFIIFYVICYVLCIFMVYISTHQNLSWHLDTSASRILMTVNVLSVAAFLHFAGIIYDLLKNRWRLN